MLCTPNENNTLYQSTPNYNEHAQVSFYHVDDTGSPGAPGTGLCRLSQQPAGGGNCEGGILLGFDLASPIHKSLVRLLFYFNFDFLKPETDNNTGNFLLKDRPKFMGYPGRVYE